MPEPEERPEDTTPSVPWDDSGVVAAEDPATQVVPTGHDGQTRIIPTAGGEQPVVPPPAGPHLAAPPPGSPWRQTAAPPPANPWATAPGGPTVPPGGPTLPPGGPTPSTGAPYGPPWSAPQPPRTRSRAWIWVLVLAGLVALAGAGIVAGLVIVRGSDGPEQLRADCEAGNPMACEDLYQGAAPGSAEEEFGRTCGGRTDGTVACTEADMDVPANSWVEDEGAVDDAPGEDAPDGGLWDGGAVDTYGDDPRLDELWDACAAGDMVACDDLFWESPYGSDYERFGDSCGDTTSGGTWCEPGREE